MLFLHYNINILAEVFNSVRSQKVNFEVTSKYDCTQQIIYIYIFFNLCSLSIDLSIIKPRT
jgi:phosphate starvation-inducible membrane PsiE